MLTILIKTFFTLSVRILKEGNKQPEQIFFPYTLGYLRDSFPYTLRFYIRTTFLYFLHL